LGRRLTSDGRAAFLAFARAETDGRLFDGVPASIFVEKIGRDIARLRPLADEAGRLREQVIAYLGSEADAHHRAADDSLDAEDRETQRAVARRLRDAAQWVRALAVPAEEKR